MSIRTIKFHRGIWIGLRSDVFETDVSSTKEQCIEVLKEYFFDYQLGRAYDGAWLFTKDFSSDQVEEIAFYYRDGVLRFEFRINRIMRIRILPTREKKIITDSIGPLLA